MGRYFNIFLVLLEALVLSCGKITGGSNTGEPSNGNMVDVEFTASTDTKTHLAADGLSVIWQAGDEISVFAAQSGRNYKFTLKEGVGLSSAVFSGQMEDTDAACEEFYALYPYDEAATISGGVITAKGMSNDINYNKWGSFPNKSCQSVAHALSGESFNFKLTQCLLTLIVPASLDKQLNQITISSNDGSSEAFIGGTVAITVEDAENDNLPSVEFTSIGNSNINVSSSTGIDKATYYFPVYPTTISKGVNIRLRYLDNHTEYIFTGRAVAFRRGVKFPLGTIYPQPSFILDSFENYEINSSGVTSLGLSNYISGNTNALLVAANPVASSSVNSSSKVLYNNMSAATWSTSGLVTFTLTSTAIKEKFPYGVRERFAAVRFKLYFAESLYVPRFGLNSVYKRPSKINGTSISGLSQDEVLALISHSDWNEFEFNLAECGFTKETFEGVDSFQLRPFVDYNNTQTEGISETNQKFIYIDDIEFLY